MSCNIPSKVITCNDKDEPWITNEIKTATKRNARVHRKWVLRWRVPEERGHIRSVQNETNRKIKKAKNNYFLNHREKRSIYGTGSKSFWLTFKRLVNKKKITNIKSSPIFGENLIFLMIIFLINVL